MIWSIISISFGATAGALLRYGLGNTLNPIFPSIPLGTLTANIIGGFLMGLFISLSKNHLFLPEAIRLAITTGFLGGLTTFSTFSAETVTLLLHKEYLLTILIILSHVAGSVIATILGMYTIKLLTP